MAGRIVLLVTLALVFIGGISVVDSAHVTGSPNTAIENETWVPDAGNVTTLSDSNLERAYYDPAATVYDENKTLMDPAGNYTWYQSNGTIEATTGGDLDGDANATISYGYQQASTTSTGIATLFGGLFSSGSSLLLVLAAAGVLVALLALSGGGM